MTTIEESSIRGLDIDKTVKGFELLEYTFKELCTVSSTASDTIRWYQETAADPSATSPSTITISPLSQFPTLTHSWTRNTSYVKKYGAECFISMEDIKSADIDVLSRMLLRLTRAVVKQRDTDIWNVITESQSASTILSGNTVLPWDNASATPFKDIICGARNIYENNYDASKAELLLNPYDYASLMNYLIVNGSQFGNFGGELAQNGAVTRVAGHKVRVSNNVTTDYFALVIPQTACTYKMYQDTTSRVIEEPGIGSKLRVWALGIPLLTDPKAVYLGINTKT